MKRRNKIYIGLIILIIILAIGFLVWWNHKKTIDKKYQACLEICQTESIMNITAEEILEAIRGNPTQLDVCKLKCKEEYGK